MLVFAANVVLMTGCSRDDSQAVASEGGRADHLQASPADRVEMAQAQVANSPESLQHQIELGYALVERSAWVEAYQTAEKILERTPEDPDGLVIMALVRTAMGMDDKARDLFDQALRKQPDHHRALAESAALLRRGGVGVAAAANGAPKAVPSVVADPQCIDDCASFGRCVIRSGKCEAGASEHCQQSDACRVSGSCSLKQMRNDDLTPFTLCRAATDDDCEMSEECKSNGNCRAMDGWCTNPDDPETRQRRSDTIADARRRAFELTTVCESTKAESLQEFRDGGYVDPSSSWAKMEGLDREMIGVVIQFRRGILANYDIVLKTLEGDQELIGAGCHAALSSGITKAKDDCLFNGDKQSPGWLKTLGKTACGT